MTPVRDCHERTTAMSTVLCFPGHEGTVRLSRRLEEAGHQFVRPSSAGEAIRMVRQGDVDVVVAEILSSAGATLRTNGAGLLVWALARERGIPVVACTPDPDSLEDLMLWPADAYAVGQRRADDVTSAVVRIAARKTPSSVFEAHDDADGPRTKYQYL
jgi:hypothetical protein